MNNDSEFVGIVRKVRNIYKLERFLNGLLAEKIYQFGIGTILIFLTSITSYFN